jgi:mannose-6-phosphate isomerase class I
MPACKSGSDHEKYDIYPAFGIGEGKISRGLRSLAKVISGNRTVIIDGFAGIFYDFLRIELDSILKDEYNTEFSWIDSSLFLKPEKDINLMVMPFLGGDDPVFGKRTDLSLCDFFDLEKINNSFQSDKDIHYIIYGIGASLFSDKGLLIYLDLPKNELQFRARAGTVTNLGASMPDEPKSMYKRFYFVDWVVLGKHKQVILNRIDILADGQRADDITWIKGDDFRNSLNDLSNGVIRVRPWFESGTWGGSWIINNIKGVNPDVPNYAWSFELITPENGLLIESSGLMMEYSFDFLMFQEAKSVLGNCYKRFGTDFPIRFDFLDTFDGGNLSIQCHPRPEYMLENFGENFTQEESYYILDTKDNAEVYLGFQEGVSREEFRAVLNGSFQNNSTVKTGDFIQTHASHKHDLFLIPSGTIHGAGKDNLVLEISSTPYIFTFKMYDWLRPDLDGKPRPLNINRGMENLYFDRMGDKVKDELVCKPVFMEEGQDWKLFHLPTHFTQLYDIKRYHFSTVISVFTEGRFHVLNLVEGTGISIEIAGRKTEEFRFAETFIIPAAVKNYHVINLSDKPAIIVIAFVK